MMQEEVYRNVNLPDYSHLYEVSNHGNVRSIKTQKILKSFTKDGYNYISLSNGKGKTFMNHRLVAMTFPEIAHELKKRVSDSHQTDQHADAVSKRKRSVVQMTLEGEEIARYESIAYAEKATGASNISTICNSKKYKTSLGYHWAYTNEQLIEPQPEGKSLPEFPNYIITCEGRVYSLIYRRYLTAKIHDTGYTSILLSNKKTRKKFYLHSLVAELYPEEEKQVHNV